MVFSMSNAGTILNRPMHRNRQTMVNMVTMGRELRIVQSLRRTIMRLQVVSLSSVNPSRGLRLRPNESSTGVTTKVVSNTNITVMEQIIPTHFMGRIGMTRNESRDTIVVRPQKHTDQPISVIVSSTALRRSPCMRIRPLKYENRCML